MADNHIYMQLTSCSENVGVVRVAAAAFAAQADLTLSEIDELKVAISEAVSNSIIHGYENRQDGKIEVSMQRYADRLEFKVIDYGKGIEDIVLARQPSYSSDPERMGLGFVFMETFMDGLEVTSTIGQGTTVIMYKKIQMTGMH